MTDDRPTTYAIVRAMEQYGGHFVRALAAACHRADPENLERIIKAFPELWAEYAVMALEDHRAGKGPR